MGTDKSLTESAGPLHGVRVLDLSRALAGPFCAMMLGDLGADVIKVENPVGGDETRGWGPPYAGGESAYYLSANRNKRSLTLNVKDVRGADLLKRLAAQSDIVIENFAPGAADRHSIGWDALHRINTRLIYCRISSFRPGTRYESEPGYDFVIQAMSGLMSITGRPDGEPQKVGVAVVDILAGLFACSSVLAALHERDVTGTGRMVEVSLLDAALASLVNVASSYLVTGRRPQRWGNAHANLVPYQTFSTADGEIAIGAGNDAQFGRLCAVLGHPEWPADGRFQSNPARVQNRDVLIQLLMGTFKTRTTNEWIEALAEARVPAAPVNHVDEIFADPYVNDAHMVTTVDHPTAGELNLVSSPLTLDGHRPTVRRPPPRHGEHTDEVLREILGLSQPEVDQLREAGAL